MGPASLPTPLSPAVGSRRNAYRLACPALRPKALSGMSPGARAGAGSVGGQVRSEDPSFALGSSETGRRAWLLERPCLSEDGQFLETGPVRPAFPTARPRGFNAPGFDRSEDLPLPFAPPRGISRSRLERFQNLFFYQGVTPSIRRANPRSRCVEDAPEDRVGQASKARVIHFQAKQRWTKVDKSTVRRTSFRFPTSVCLERSREALGQRSRVSTALDTNGEGDSNCPASPAAVT
jgi:hypothetical protein